MGLEGSAPEDTTRQKFTGYERDDETGLDFAEARYYGSTMGRFASVDPVLISEERLYDPQQINLYGYARNNPLKFVDPNGEQIWIAFEETDADGKKSTQRVQYKNGKLFGTDGKEYAGNNSYALKVRDHLNGLKDDDVLNARIGTLESSKQTHTIQNVDNPRQSRSDPESLKNAENNKPTGSTVYLNPDKDVALTRDGVSKPGEVLAHELLGHSWDFDQGKERRGSVNIPFTDEVGNKAMGSIAYREIDAVKIENRARTLLGSPQRQYYGGWKIPGHLLQSAPSRKRVRR